MKIVNPFLFGERVRLHSVNWSSPDHCRQLNTERREALLRFFARLKRKGFASLKKHIVLEPLVGVEGDSRYRERYRLEPLELDSTFGLFIDVVQSKERIYEHA